MDNYTAVGIAEGFLIPKYEEQYLEAWQHIYDHKLHLTLQGRFGRIVNNLVDAGFIKTNNNE
jgi:hypothetical protein